MNYTSNLNLYKWNSVDQKADTINEMANNMDKIDASLADIATNPVSYNVVGDGTVDDTTELQNLFNSINDNTWVLLTKTYKVSMVTLNGKKNIKFVGNGTIIHNPTDTSQSYTQANPLSTMPCIKLTNCQDIEFCKGLDIKAYYEGLYVDSSCSDITFKAAIDGQSSSKFSGLFFSGTGLDFNGVIKNCGVLPVWNGTQNPYSTCNGLHISQGSHVNVKGEIFGNGMNGVYAYASSDITIDKSAFIHGNGMSGVQLAFASGVTNQSNYKISGTISNNYADGIDVNNTTGTNIDINLLINDTIQENNGWMGSNSTQDGSGIATLKYVNKVLIGINKIKNCNRAGIYILGCQDVRSLAGDIEKLANSQGEGIYLQDVTRINLLGLRVKTVNEGLKAYGTLTDVTISNFDVETSSTTTGSLIFPQTGVTYNNVKLINSNFKGGVAGSNQIPPIVLMINTYVDQWAFANQDPTWKTPTLQNSWVNYGGSEEVASYRIYIGKVEIKGLIANGTTASNTILFTLPVGFRPTKNRRFSVANAEATANILVKPTGDVMLDTTKSTNPSSWLSLEGIRFMAEQ